MSEDDENAASTAIVVQKRVVGRPFQKGASGNPKGRPAGSRNVLVEASIKDLLKVYAEDPEGLWRRLREEYPQKFAEIVAKLLPAKLEASGPEGGPLVVRWDDDRA